MLHTLVTSFFERHPVRVVAKRVIRILRLGSYDLRVRIGAVKRPYYGYIVYNAAVLARKLGYPRISVLEFGVAGGNGLVSLEEHALEASKRCSVEVEVYGFDTGEGLPEPSDFRDLPYHFKKGFFRMDVPKLQARLQKARLVLGNIEHTAKEFFRTQNPAPIGAISYDFDFYSSTVPALAMLAAGEQHYLPRVFCYFDDVIGSETELYNDYTGERLAINEFNRAHEKIKLAIPYHLVSRQIVEAWYHQIRICHFFEHSRYNDFVSREDQQLPC